MFANQQAPAVTKETVCLCAWGVVHDDTVRTNHDQRSFRGQRQDVMVHVFDEVTAAAGALAACSDL